MSRPNHRLSRFEEGLYGYVRYRKSQHRNHDKKVSRALTRAKDKEALRIRLTDEMTS